ncbi:MAG: SRPBCC family protein [Candidatus Eremiobacteraeota bacterium]|nr:SRPBCC family protein [Candidatus Eremiobacteraeota bacterium]MBV8366595.1 SRPBCC family protein [Candidatus Eremiobacteraeota bacterium]
MKAVCSACIDIGAPVARVYDFVGDLRRWPLWLSFIVCAQQQGEPLGELAYEQEVEICMQRGRRRWRESFDVVRCVPNAFVWLEGSLSAARRMEFRFEQRRSGTRLHCSIGYALYGGGFGKLRDALFERRTVARELARSLMNLRTALEDVEHVEEGMPFRKANQPLPA